MVGERVLRPRTSPRKIPNNGLTKEAMDYYKLKRIHTLGNKELFARSIRGRVRTMCAHGKSFLDVSIELGNQGAKVSPSFVRKMWGELVAKDPRLLQQRFGNWKKRFGDGGKRETAFFKAGLITEGESFGVRARRARTKNSQSATGVNDTQGTQKVRTVLADSEEQLGQAKSSLTVFAKTQPRLERWVSTKRLGSKMPATLKEDTIEFLESSGIKKRDFDLMLDLYKRHFRGKPIQSVQAIADKLRGLNGPEQIHAGYSEIFQFSSWANTRTKRWKLLEE